MNPTQGHLQDHIAKPGGIGTHPNVNPHWRYTWIKQNREGGKHFRGELDLTGWEGAKIRPLRGR